MFRDHAPNLSQRIDLRIFCCYFRTRVDMIFTWNFYVYHGLVRKRYFKIFVKMLDLNSLGFQRLWYNLGFIIQQNWSNFRTIFKHLLRFFARRRRHSLFEFCCLWQYKFIFHIFSFKFLHNSVSILKFYFILFDLFSQFFDFLSDGFIFFKKIISLWFKIIKLIT